MTQCGNRIHTNHARSHVAHNLANAHPELRRIAMYPTFPAAGFPLPFRAFIHTRHDIIQQPAAIIAQALAAMLPPAIMHNHLRHYPLFTLNPIHQYRVCNFKKTHRENTKSFQYSKKLHPVLLIIITAHIFFAFHIFSLTSRILYCNERQYGKPATTS